LGREFQQFNIFEMKNLNIIWVIVMALNISPVLGQSKAKRTKIIADCETAEGWSSSKMTVL
jgi:hypothetical protein